MTHSGRGQAGEGAALVIVGHGSHLNPDSSVPVFEHAARIRSLGLFDEVLEAFWKEEPTLRDALDLVSSDRVYVVPLFLAEGYFTRQVVPRELGLTGTITQRNGRTIYYCPPVGAHPAMKDLVLRRALEITSENGVDPRATALVIIGHGTDRSATSGASVYRLTDALGSGGEFSSVSCGFLDEDPRIDVVVGSIDAPDVILVPFFVAQGWHTAETIPRDLELTGHRTSRGGQTIWYTPPVGTLPAVAELVVSLAREAGASPSTRSDEPIPEAEIAVARREFVGWVDSSGTEGREFIQLRIRRLVGGRYDVVHADEGSRGVAQPRRYTDPRDALAIARRDAQGRYRALRTARSLPTGWALSGLDEDGLWTALSLFYPAAVLGWYRARVRCDGARRMPITSFEDWARRQTGIYDGLGRLSGSEIVAVTEKCCASCAREPLWRAAERSTIGRSADFIPCVEPCTLFATFARETLDSGDAASVA